VSHINGPNYRVAISKYDCVYFDGFIYNKKTTRQKQFFE